jgi:rRNA maturation RNase YbeY
VVSVETAARQAAAHDHDVAVEVGVLVAHGLLHLCGLDHERGADDAERQVSAEMSVLAFAGLPVDAALGGRGF